MSVTRILLLHLLLLLIWGVSGVSARTFVLEGDLDSSLTVTQQIRFSVDKQIDKLSFRFALPTGYGARSVTQEIRDVAVTYAPEPDKIEDDLDRFGNRFRRATWKDLATDARITVASQVRIRTDLPKLESTAPYPLPAVSPQEGLFLKATKQVQSDDAKIRTKASELTAGLATEYEAVTAIMTYVADAIRYTYNPPQYDALYTMGAGTGNCQNLAHFSLALLRASGIPARIVGGITLSDAWQVPLEQGQTWSQKMGQGGHAWIEIYFPDLGWLPYDPLYSRQFTPTRHIKQSHGLDCEDINDSWLASPSYPTYNETIGSSFSNDRVAIRVAETRAVPRTNLLGSRFVAKAAAPGVPATWTKPEPAAPPKPKPKPPAPPAPVLPPVKPDRLGIIEFGNTDFPTLVDAYRMVGNEGRKILDKETSEYVTSRKRVYAQAFTTDSPFTLQKISLALRKFGGDGTLFVDVVADDKGRPGLDGVRSSPLFVETITRKPGYYWVDFTFPADLTKDLKKGKYWIVLRSSGETIVNWFYIPGKPYSDSDDTRSTAKGYQWEDILNYDFVFKVTGKKL